MYVHGIRECALERVPHTHVYVSIGRQKDQMCIEVSGEEEEEEGRAKGRGDGRAERQKNIHRRCNVRSDGTFLACNELFFFSSSSLPPPRAPLSPTTAMCILYVNSCQGYTGATLLSQDGRAVLRDKEGERTRCQRRDSEKGDIYNIRRICEARGEKTVYRGIYSTATGKTRSNVYEVERESAVGKQS